MRTRPAGKPNGRTSSAPRRRATLGGCCALAALVAGLAGALAPASPESAAAAVTSSAYRAEVIADSPRAYWRLGEASGTTARSETSPESGSYQGGVQLGRPGAPAGDSNTAAGFDGINDTVRVPSSPRLNAPAALSLEAWLRPPALPRDSATLIRKEGHYLLRVLADGAVGLRLWKGGTGVELTTGPGAAAAGAWTHVVGTWNGSTMTLYVNGKALASRALTGPIDGKGNGNALYLASSWQAYDWLAGTLDEVAVYAQGLSAARVSAHYQAALPPPDTTSPVVTLTTPASGTSMYDSTPTFAGAAGTDAGDADSVTVKVYAGASAAGTPVESLTAQRSGGSWSVDASPPLADGTYTAQAEQRDAAGNTGSSEPATFTVRAPAPAYRDVVVADSPRAYWRLGERSGETAADELGASPGVYRGGVRLGEPGALTGDPDTAALLDGVDDRVRVLSGPALQSSAALTLEAWVRPTSLPAGTATILRKDGQYLLRLTSNGSLVFRLWKSGSAFEVTTGPGVAAGAWSHVAATFDGAAMTVYVNGVARASLALAGPVDISTSSLLLGTSSEAYDWLAGKLDEVAVYDRALPLERLRAHYGAAGDASPPAVSLGSPAAGSTMDATPTFGGLAGTAEGDSDTVTVRIHAGTSASGALVQTLTTVRRSAGAFSVKASSPLASGTYTAQAEQPDVAGNVGTSAPATFAVEAGGDPVVLAAGDIAACDTFGDEATAALLDRLPGTVTTLGDHVYEDGTAADFADCYDPTWGRHKARTAPTVGGHEYRTPGAAPYFDYFGAAAGERDKGYYSYNLGSWHVISLNANCDLVGGCGPGSPMEQWLRADLAGSLASCTLTILHEPRFSSGAIHGSQVEMEPLWQALYDAGAEVVLSGDDHVYERFAPQTPSGAADPARGIRQIVAGTGGRSHYGFAQPQPNSEVRNGDSFGVVKLTLHPGSYDWAFVPEAGKTFSDSGTGACH